MQPDSTLAILFVGTNNTLPVNSDEEKRPIINLNTLSTFFHPNGFTIKTPHGNSKWPAPLSSVLVCDPRVEISGGRAQLTPSKQLSVVASQLPPVGTMPYDAITTIFSLSLPSALDTDDITMPPWIGSVSAQVFLTDVSLNFTAYPHGVPLLNLATVNNNLNIYATSGSKAFLDGLYADPSNQLNISTQTRSVIAFGEVEKQALVGDMALGIASLCLSIGSVVLFAVLMYLILTNVGKTFELRNLLPVLDAQASKSSSHSE